MSPELIVAKRTLLTATQALVNASAPGTRHYKDVVDALARVMSIDAETPIELRVIVHVPVDTPV